MELHYFKPENGKFNFEDPFYFESAPNRLRSRRHVVEIKEYHEKRSLGLNAYYWRIVIHYFCMEWFGAPAERWHTKEQRDEMHAILGQMHRQVESEVQPGVYYVKGTSTMTGREMWAYIDKCYLTYAEYYGGQIPPPHSVGFIPREETENDRRAA